MKKQGIGTWLSLLTIVIGIVALIVYFVAVASGNNLTVASGSENFYDFTRPEDAAMPGMVLTGSILALVFLVVAIVLDQFKFEGIVGKVCGFVVSALRIVAPALLMFTFLYFLYGSFTGLGWTFFSNAELEIDPKAVQTGYMVITGMILFLVSSIVSIVASYCTMAKKEA